MFVVIADPRRQSVGYAPEYSPEGGSARSDRARVSHLPVRPTCAARRRGRLPGMAGVFLLLTGPC
jgi:hypothetical protein